MPTTLSLAFHKVDAPREGSAIAPNRDLAVVAAFTAIGRAVAIGLAVLIPQAANAVALALIVAE